MSRRLPLLLALLGVLLALAAGTALVAPLPSGGAVGTALHPEYPDVNMTGGLQVLSNEQYEQVYGRGNVVGQRRRLAAGAGSLGAVLLVGAAVLRARQRR